MPVVSSRLDASAEVQALIQQRERAPLRLLVRVVFSNQQLDLAGEEAADRSIPLGRENLGLAEGSAVQPDRDVLRDGLVGRHRCLLARIIRAARMNGADRLLLACGECLDMK